MPNLLPNALPRLLVSILLTVCWSTGWALQMPMPDTMAVRANRPTKQAVVHPQDIADVGHRAFPWLHIIPHDSASFREGKKFLLIIPQIGYTLQTKALAAVLVNMPFRRPNANMSSANVQLSYTQNSQLILTANSSIFSRNNRYIWNNDWRLMHYPQATYGLGMYTTTDREINMDYYYFRFYNSYLRKLGSNLYGGIGYYLDLHWNIDSYIDGPNGIREFTRISRYPYGVQGRSVSSGPSLHLLYDSRRNAINPAGGMYMNAVLRANMEELGSDDTYQSLLLEGRKYVHLNPHTDNVLAFWSYNVLTLSGNPPFLDLPSTGWDMTGNVGRGFIQGRFRGKNMLYAETEYRFHITRNRLIGGVVFANAQTVTEQASGDFEKVVPAVGGGLRLRMNKVTRTNLSVDYGFGMDGSHGLFFNLGEVF